ncbi:MAG: HEPN domain-containing protein [Deltaproteobacteria bacterium]|nr:HEPN domain-containing protein [Deltaproteobacteria bacterium]
MANASPLRNAVSTVPMFCGPIYEEHHLAFPRIHDLIALLNLSGGLIPELDPLKPRLAHLSIFGIASRYPGVRADRKAAEEAMTTAEDVRTVVRAKLGLP